MFYDIFGDDGSSKCYTYNIWNSYSMCGFHDYIDRIRYSVEYYTLGKRKPFGSDG